MDCTSFLSFAFPFLLSELLCIAALCSYPLIYYNGLLLSRCLREYLFVT